jgi:putative chitinase
MAKAFVSTLNSTQKQNLDVIISTLKNGGFTNPLIIAGICGIISKESVFTLVREGMKYSTSRLGEVWPRLKGRSDLANNEEKLANEVYGGKYGNGPKDGYKYRGGGFNQLTFKALYEERGKQTGTHLGTNPDSISTNGVASKVLVFYYKDAFAYFKKKGILKEYGSSSDFNGFKDLQGAVLAAYHATAGTGHSVSKIKGYLKSDSLGGMTKALANAPDLLKYIEKFSGLKSPPQDPSTETRSDGGAGIPGSPNTVAETPPVKTPKPPPDPQNSIAKLKLVKKSGPGELMGEIEFETFLGEGKVKGIQFDEPGEYVIQVVPSDERIIPLEFTMSVAGEPSPKSQEKAVEEKVEGNRPIIAQIDPPTVNLPPIKFDIPPSDDQAVVEMATSIGLNPFLWLNGYQIKEKNIMVLSLYHEGMVPCCQATFVDEAGILKKQGFPTDDTPFEVFLTSGSKYIKSIHLKFKMTNFRENSDKSHSITGMLDLKDFYKINFNSYTGTSFEILKNMCKELQLGFNSNINTTNDTMKWSNVGQTWRDFMSSIIQHSYISDTQFTMGYIDFYYSFNYVDVEKEWQRDNSTDVGISLGSQNKMTAANEEEKLQRLVLTNEKSMNGSDLFFINPQIMNNSTAKSIQSGQKTITKYYDTAAKSFLIFDIESQTGDDPNKVILKGKQGDASELEENYRTNFGGKIDTNNVHVNYAYARDLNSRNLSEMNKISVSLELPTINYNLYKYQKINLKFINEAGSAADPNLTQERITGNWIILDIKYIWVKGKLSQNITCMRKDLEKTLEEKQNTTTDKKAEVKEKKPNIPVKEVPPNSIFAIDDELTVKAEDGYMYSITVTKLLENGNEIEGYVLELIDQPFVPKPPPPPPPPKPDPVTTESTGGGDTGGSGGGSADVGPFKEVKGLKLDKLKGIIPDSVIAQIPKTAAQFGITTNLRLAHFLAQLMHESGNFKYTEEIASGSAYEGRKDLGNTQAGDGKRYKGRGYIQLTGRANYTKFKEFCGEDTVANPALVASKFPMLSAGYFFDKTKLFAKCDEGSGEEVVKKVSKRVNGGYNGLADRLEKFAKVWKVLG